MNDRLFKAGVQPPTPKGPCLGTPSTGEHYLISIFKTGFGNPNKIETEISCNKLSGLISSWQGGKASLHLTKGHLEDFYAARSWLRANLHTATPKMLGKLIGFLWKITGVDQKAKWFFQRIHLRNKCSAVVKEDNRREPQEEVGHSRGLLLKAAVLNDRFCCLCCGRDLLPGDPSEVTVGSEVSGPCLLCGEASLPNHTSPLYPWTESSS